VGMGEGGEVEVRVLLRRELVSMVLEVGVLRVLPAHMTPNIHVHKRENHRYQPAGVNERITIILT
jgi:hypothetical protein